MDTNQVRFTLILVGLLILLAIAYLVRVAVAGRARYDRVEKQGGSALLSKALMEMTYWAMQPISKLLTFLKVTPNQLTWASLAFAVAAATQLGRGFFGTGAALATVSALLDLLDGLVARSTQRTSPTGQVLDSSIDRVSEFLFLGAVVFFYRDQPLALILALAALMGSFMVSYSTAKSEAMHISLPNRGILCVMRRPERAFYLILGAGLSPVLPSSPIGPTLPMLLALALVAVVSNIAAAARLREVAREAENRAARERAQAAAEAAAIRPLPSRSSNLSIVAQVTKA